MSDTHSDLQTAISWHMVEILKLFRVGAKATVVVTNDAYGDAGLMCTNDDPDRVIQEIRRRQVDAAVGSFKLEPGCVAKDDYGKIGVVYGTIPDGDSSRGQLRAWTGSCFDGRPWKCRSPVVIAESVEKYVEGLKVAPAPRGG